MKNKILEFRFIPTKDFEWFREDTQVLVGHYTKGSSYNCSRQPIHDALRGMCSKWQEAGDIKVIPLNGENFIIKKVED
jgi:hypothetical protein